MISKPSDEVFQITFYHLGRATVEEKRNARMSDVPKKIKQHEDAAAALLTMYEWLKTVYEEKEDDRTNT